MGRPRFLHYIMAVWNLDMAGLPHLCCEHIPVLGGVRGARWRCWRCTSGCNYDALSSGLVEPRRTAHRHNNRIFPALAWSLDYGESRRTREREITCFRPQRDRRRQKRGISVKLEYSLLRLKLA